MKLKKLIKNLDVQIKGSKEIEITGISIHSKRVVPGNLFIAKNGYRHNGRDFLQEAINGGACAIITDVYNPFLDKRVTQIISDYPELLEGEMADRFYDSPCLKLLMIAVTGTNGKTTIAYMVKQVLEILGYKTGLIGTMGHYDGSRHYPAENTTPDLVTNQKLLQEMTNHGCRAAVLEATSIGVHQRRLEKITFDAIIYTNLSMDHLDYHETMQKYAESKQCLFKEHFKQSSNHLENPLAIINKDCSWNAQILKNCPAQKKYYALDKTADIRGKILYQQITQTSYQIQVLDRCFDVTTELIGRFNIYNMLSVFSLAYYLKCCPESIIAAINKIKSIKGRLERVFCDLDTTIYIDYAHTPDALESTLSALKEVSNKNIYCVFGCGGDRDKSKRKLMGKVTEKYADYCIITSDNPRSEDPLSICEDIAKGFSDKNRYGIQIDRKEAIRSALIQSSQDSIILIAGKGHETYQVLSYNTIEFDDSKVIKQLAGELTKMCR